MRNTRPPTGALGVLPGRGELLLQQRVQRTRSGGAAVHRGEDLHVTARIEPEAFSDAGACDVDGQGGGGFGVVAWEEEEVAHALQDRGSACVDPVGVADHSGVCGLPEHLSQSDSGNPVGGEQIP